MYGLSYLLYYLSACLTSLDLDIGGIFELLGNIDLGVLVSHLQGELNAFFYTLSDITVIVYRYDFGPVMGNELTALLTYGIGHDDHGLIASYRSNERKAYTLIAACGFYYDTVRG